MAAAEQGLSVRRANSTDRYELAYLWRDFLEEQASMESRLGMANDAVERWLNDFPVWLNDETVRIFVAWFGGRIVGFVVAHRWAPPPIYAETSEIFVDELFVNREYRGGGAGAALLSSVRDWAFSVSADRLRMNVLEANKPGLAFWERHRAVPFSRTLTIELESSKEDRNKRNKIGFL